MKIVKTTRRAFLNCMALGAMVIGVPGWASAMEVVRQRPNIVLIMADDMGFSDIGCYGGEIETPNLDGLAGGGLRFTQFYNTARCFPTRASLMTGLYPHQTGVGHMMSDRGLEGYRGDLNNRCVTIAQVLKLAGYRTYLAGKWHVTRHWRQTDSKHNWPRQRGYDRFFGTIQAAGSFFDPYTLTRGNRFIVPDSDDFYYTDAISDNAAKFVSEHKSGRPFFMYVAYTSPHWPMHAKAEDIAKYKGRYEKGWDVLRAERHQRMIEMGIVKAQWKITPRDPRAPAWEDAELKPWFCRRMEVYAAMIDCMDQGIGRIVAALKKTGQLDNTLIFFLADNGGCAEEHGSRGRVKPNPSKPVELKPMQPGELQTRMQPTHTRDGRPVRTGRRVMPGPADTYIAYGLPWANASNTPFRLYKHWVHEGGIATPLVVHWPRRIKGEAGGQLRHQPGHLIDIMSTCVDVANADYPARYKGIAITPMEGRSLVPAFDNRPIGRRAIYFEHERNRAVRAGKWKLVAKGGQGPWELYDIEADRTELNNLAEEEPERVKRMAAMWQAWAERAHVIPWAKPKSKKPPKKPKPKKTKSR